jgi:hypothetical protein
MKELFIASTIVNLELTQEEVEMIIKKRERDAHLARRNKYIEEMKDLLARAKADGFTFGRKDSNILKITEVEPWGDAAENWIRLV